MANEKIDVFDLYSKDVGDDDCWTWNGVWGGRSRTLRPYYQYGNTRKIAYRVVYELITGVDLTSDQLIRHTCDNGGHPTGCGNPKHLTVGTHTENMDDMKQRQRHGLPHSVVKALRMLAEQGRDRKEIAELYGVTLDNLEAILDGRSYKHVD